MTAVQKSISSLMYVIWQHVFVLTFGFILAFFLTILILVNIKNIWYTYKKHVGKSSSSSSTNDVDDNEHYLKDEVVIKSAKQNFDRQMDNTILTYKEHNKKIKEYAKARDKKPEDIIDDRIFDKSYDSYE